MIREEVEVEIRKIIAEKLNVVENEIDDDSKITNLGADSLDRVEILITIEEKFDIEINDSEAENVNTFGELVDLTMKTIGEGKK